jgi:ATP-dependent DNA helicase RecQ
VRTGLTREQIYNILITLTQRRIVDYIPRRKTPYIIYTRERQELRYIHISPAVYEERKARYESRILAMETYATEVHACRSRMLLRYFGEQNEHNCGQCDICLNHRTDQNLPEDSFDALKQQIIRQLSLQTLTPAGIVRAIEADKELINIAIRHLLEEGEVKMTNGILSITQ